MTSFQLAGLLTAACAAVALSPGVQAQASKAVAPASAKASPLDEFTRGKVHDIDSKEKEITLEHAEIKNLGMPPMAMAFKVRDPSMLNRFKPGDKVRFKAVFEKGDYVLTEIQRVR
jgi:Cu/Ag efflux protein CusF